MGAFPFWAVCWAPLNWTAWLTTWGTFRCLSPVSYHTCEHTHRRAHRSHCNTQYTTSHVKCTTDDALCCVRHYHQGSCWSWKKKKTVGKQCKGNHYIVLYVRKDIFRDTFDTELMTFADVSLQSAVQLQAGFLRGDGNRKLIWPPQ